MLIDEAKRKAVATAVNDLDVVVTTAGKTEQDDKSLPMKQTKQGWRQTLGLTDTSGHIWAILPTKSYRPVVKGCSLIIKDAMIDEFTNKGGDEEKRLLIGEYDIPATVGEPASGKPQAEGILDPMVEQVLDKYGIVWTDALWPCTHKNKDGSISTNWIIYHRYCEQIAAKAGIVFDMPQVVKDGRETDDNGKKNGEVVLLITGRLGYIQEWSYGEASPKTTVIPYIWAMAEKRGKDRVILKLAGFHGMVYSESEEHWQK